MMKQNYPDKREHVTACNMLFSFYRNGYDNAFLGATIFKEIVLSTPNLLPSNLVEIFLRVLG